MKKKTIPIATSIVAAGFPSPAQDENLDNLDLNDFLIKHPNSTFFVRVGGDSMVNAGIFDNDILVVDRSITAKNGDIVIAVYNRELTVKRLIIKNKQTYILQPENPKFKPIVIDTEEELEIWGIVTSVIHKYK
jgi:DNA polymerase V